MCNTGLFNIAAHPDLVKIHSIEDFCEWQETPQTPIRIRAALVAMKEADMAMEVSSAGLRKPCKEIYPCPLIMKMAAELALPISFGSDAHCAETPAFAFDELARYAHSFGYRESRIFIQRRPQDLPFAQPPASPLCRP
jgi:histidinol-phosphatase (PHP family)